MNKIDNRIDDVMGNTDGIITRGDIIDIVKDVISECYISISMSEYDVRNGENADVYISHGEDTLINI